MRTTGSMVGGSNTRHIEEDDIESLTRGQSRGQESQNVGSSSLGIQGDVAGSIQGTIIGPQQNRPHQHVVGGNAQRKT
ncbi:hypothetical protein COP2_009970 [Malus domestica]